MTNGTNATKGGSRKQDRDGCRKENGLETPLHYCMPHVGSICSMSRMSLLFQHHPRVTRRLKIEANEDNTLGLTPPPNIVVSSTVIEPFVVREWRFVVFCFLNLIESTKKPRMTPATIIIDCPTDRRELVVLGFETSLDE